ncbi:MAG TPA: hypothetical protein PLY87_27720, partial [Planctomycetaceae bacterium]|nr:hypothetical protein [Planctomycetaceae bacterium]
GTQLTLEQSQAVWEGRDVKEANTDDVRELLNYRDAFQLVSKYLSSALPITETLKTVAAHFGLVFRRIDGFVTRSSCLTLHHHKSAAFELVGEPFVIKACP